VSVTIVNEWWLRIGEKDWREITSSYACNGTYTSFILPSRLAAAEQLRARRLGEAWAAGLSLKAALEKLDGNDKPRAAGLSRLLKHWLEPGGTNKTNPVA